jgi:hypothetical protein
VLGVEALLYHHWTKSSGLLMGMGIGRDDEY